jgi:hypothetical protein
MTRTWTYCALFALAAASLAVSTTRATPPEPPAITDDKAILIQLQTITSKLNAMQATQDTQLKSMQDDIDRLKNDVARLNDELRRLSATSNSVAASINPAAPVAPLPVGSVLVDNQYLFPATVFINGQPYRVMPFSQARINNIPSRFTYSVSTDDSGPILGSTTRTLTAGRDFPITIHQ